MPTHRSRRLVNRSPDPTVAITEAVSVAEGLEIYPRSTWAGETRPALAQMGPEEVRFLLVHHTAGASDYTEDGAIAEMQQVYGFHTGPERGWPDVCYNFFVDRFGRVFEARTGSLDGPVVADATGGSQGFAQLVCLLGDFTGQLPSPEALEALTATLGWLAARYQLDLGLDAATTFVSRGSNRWPEGTEVTTNTIAGHRDMSQTACPGDTFYPYVTSTLRTESADRLALMPAAGQPAQPTESTVGTDPVAQPSQTVPTTSADSAPSAGPEAVRGAVPATSAPGSDGSTPSAGGSETSAPIGAMLTGVGTVGILGAGAGLAWVLKRRMENQRETER